MTHEEKRAWIRLVDAVLGYAVYLVLLLNRVDGRPLTDVPYVGVMLWTIGAGVLAAIVAEVVLAAASPGASRVSDARDRQIGRLGDHVGQAFVAIGAVAAMLMAMAEWDRFWIANVVYLCFTLSATVGGVAKVVIYRRGVPEW